MTRRLATPGLASSFLISTRKQVVAIRLCKCCGEPLKDAAAGRPRKFCSPACRQAAYRKRRGRSIHFSSRTCEWETPAELFGRLDARYGPLTLDVCATAANAKCRDYFTRERDGLRQKWTGRCWCNPPYGREIGRWMEKALASVQTDAEIVVCLVPSRTDARWWHDLAARGEVEFLPGRIRFGGAPHAAPFPSAVVVFRNATTRYETIRPQLGFRGSPIHSSTG